MFKKILFFVALIASSFSAKAQFTIDEDTLYVYGAAGLVSNDFIDIYSHTVIRSTASGPQTVVWERIENTLPNPNWSSAICDIISCRPPEVSLDSFTFAAGGDTGVLSFHFYVKNIAGNGKMVVRFKQANNPLAYKDVVVIARAWDPTSVKSVKTPLCLVYPSPSSSIIRVDQAGVNNGQIRITDAMGRTVYVSDFNGSVSADISGLSNGVYHIGIYTATGSLVSGNSFVKE